MPPRRKTFACIAAVFLAYGTLVHCHEHEVTESHAPSPMEKDSNDAMETYFRHEHSRGWILAHIILSILSWVVIMPLSVMLGVARSRYGLGAQMLFHLANVLGLFCGFVYNASTPDLYQNNAHHPIGWVVSFLAMGWSAMSFVDVRRQHGRNTFGVAGRSTGSARMRRSSSVSRSSSDGNSDWRLETIKEEEHDSSECLIDSTLHRPDAEQDAYEGTPEPPNDRAPYRNTIQKLSRRSHQYLVKPSYHLVPIIHIILEKTILPLGFLALATGFVAFSGIFMGREVFNGAAHFIKGGIFFWYGLLTLARWIGAFAEFGWAWNTRSKRNPDVSSWKARVPSAEFTESFVIWAYGASNVFLEHLSGWGEEWTPADLEHLSITLLFFGGGLLGMLVESLKIKQSTGTTVQDLQILEEEQGGRSTQSDSEQISLNPLPGLVIMILGIVMSSHHQTSMVSTMVHKQWGALFCAFGLARGTTYVMLYLKPPTRRQSRPPSELVTSFCLIAGGLVFMASARDAVAAVESSNLDAMPVFTVLAGLACLLMAWEIFVFAARDWTSARGS